MKDLTDLTKLRSENYVIDTKVGDLCVLEKSIILYYYHQGIQSKDPFRQQFENIVGNKGQYIVATKVFPSGSINENFIEFFDPKRHNKLLLHKSVLNLDSKAGPLVVKVCGE